MFKSKIAENILAELAPAPTNYDRHAGYLRYDISAYLKPGLNTVGAVLGNGLYNCHTTETWHFDKATWRDYPKLLLEIVADRRNHTPVLKLHQEIPVLDIADIDRPDIQDPIRSGKLRGSKHLAERNIHIRHAVLKLRLLLRIRKSSKLYLHVRPVLSLSDNLHIIPTGAMTAAGLEPFGFFEFAWIGIPVSVAGMLYMMFVGKYLLPNKQLDADQEIEQEIEANETSKSKQMVSGVILLAVVLVMALGIKGITLEMAAIIGALVCVLTGCLTEKQAYASIDWVTIFLFAGMMPVSKAMDVTGAGKLIAEWTVGLMGGSPSPLVVTAVLFILSCGLTQFMSNTASAALLCPIGIAISKQLGADPKAVLMAIAVAASCAFATPVGTPPNTLVLGPGGYKFMDYVKAGTGLVLVAFVVSLVVIPMVWPFFPGK